MSHSRKAADNSSDLSNLTYLGQIRGPLVAALRPANRALVVDLKVFLTFG